jgi:serine/threonine protein kinase
MVKGKKVGKYELGKTLGSGSFSKVKLGVDDTGKQFAVKIIEKEQLVREHMEEQLKREISVMKLLKHPHIVQLYDVLQTQNHIYLVLELVTGGELFDRILSVKRFDEDTGRKFFQQMVVALHFCHRNGVAHRDLKPENLLVDDKDNIKITDFGLANIQKPTDKLLQTVCGTPNYVAPEVLKEVGYNGIYADVWSAGVILFVMLSGYLPFDDPNLDDLFKKIQRGDYRMCKTFSEPVKDLISKILVVDPKKRMTLDGVMKHPWFQKNFDRTVFESLNGATSTVSVESVDKHTGGTVAKESEISEAKQQAMDQGNKIQVGAFELISQLTATTMVSLTSAQPVIKIATRFVVGADVVATNQKIVAALEALKGNPKTKDEREIKGFVNCTKGLLTYIVTLIPTVVPTLTIVEVRRGRGDTLDFHEVYRALIKGLGSAVRSQPAETGEEGERGV